MNFKARKRDQFKGHKGKILRKQLYSNTRTNQEVINDEIKALQERTLQFDTSKSAVFAEFPLSKKTLKGLSSSKFEKPTDIQRESIGLAVNGNDILGAAKTGSGKTLAFIVPVLECLFKIKWTKFDGLGALVISPTRELAFQTFEVLKKVGKFHDFSAGLVIGGKPLKEEAGRINSTNIVICTPGRLLQHMDETSYFSADSLQILVLDEADRILDLGFAATMNAIIENLPTHRQTLLFSATQTRSVKDLARLSLKDPMYVSVHENACESTPSQLEQNYVVCELHDKLNMLWSFLKNHLKAKILVFLSSCQQVKYIHEAMKRLRPGIPVLALHGRMPQLRRVEVYNQFVNKQRACLFATDIAARGLDFPAVSWVLQLDCPEDANTYIHRAGRTARYEKDGQSLLVLLPSEEEGMLKQLADKKIPIDKIRINEKKLYSIQGKMESNCAAETEMKDSAQRAFVTYLRSIFLMANKKVFDVHAVDIEQYARSLGLAIAPKVRFLKKDRKRKEEQKAKTMKSAEQKLQANAKSTADGNSSDDSLESEDGESRVLENVDSDGSDTSETLTQLGEKHRTKDSMEEESDSDQSGDSENYTSTDNKEKTRKKIVEELSEENSRKSRLNLKSHEKVETKQVSDMEHKNVDSKPSRNTTLGKPGVKSELDESAGDNDASDSESDPEGISDADLHDTDSEQSGSESSDSDSSDSDSETSPESRRHGSTQNSSTFTFHVEDDDDLFTIKKNVDIDKILALQPGAEDQADVEMSNKSKKKSKVVDKFAQAKKLIRKKIVVNTKINFDEEGQPEIDRHKVPQVNIDTERPDHLGGIDLEKARSRMQAEDEIDKDIYRQKIRAKHREERFKRRDENRASKPKSQAQDEDDSEAEARLAAADDDDDDYVDPLSLIPDPDKVYSEQQHSDASDSEFSGPTSSKRRKVSGKADDRHWQQDKSSPDSSGDDNTDDDGSDVMDTELSLKDDEAFALQLLSGK